MGASSSASCQHGQNFTAMAWGLSNCYERRIEIDRCEQPIDQRQAIRTTVPACSLPLFWSPMLFKQLESVVLFVPDIDIAASWYADLFQTEVQRENAQYAFIQAPGCLLGFHPLDSKCPGGPGGPGGTTIYWEVANLPATIRELELKGAVLYRGPITTSFGAKAAILLDPFGCTLGLNQSTPQSLNALARTV